MNETVCDRTRGINAANLYCQTQRGNGRWRPSTFPTGRWTVWQTRKARMDF